MAGKKKQGKNYKNTNFYLFWQVDFSQLSEWSGFQTFLVKKDDHNKKKKGKNKNKNKTQNE